MMLQREPFQCSISVWYVPVLVFRYSPTAQILVAEMAVTLLRALWPEPLLGLAMLLHLKPFQCSISVRPTIVPELSVVAYSPTAHKLLAETALILYRESPFVPLLGLKTAFHFEPFQCS